MVARDHLGQVLGGGSTEAEEPRDGPVVEWVDTEPGFRDTVAELSRLFWRARQRKWVVVGLTLLVTGLLVLRSARGQISYGANVKLLVTESVTEATSHEQRSGTRIYSSENLRDFVANAAFTDGKILELLKKANYRTRDIETNPRVVLQSFREDVEIDVYRNHFLVDTMGAPRTANIAIGIRMPDPEQALTVARALGDLVVERDAAYRRQAYEAARNSVGYELRLIRDRIAETDAQRASAAARADMTTNRYERGELRFREKALKNQINTLDYELVRVRTRYEELRMMDNAGAMGLRFERIDWGAAETVVNKKLAVARFGIMVLFLAFPFVAMGVGGFDRRVYDRGDLERLGLVPLGVVRPPRPPATPSPPPPSPASPMARSPST